MLPTSRRLHAVTGFKDTLFPEAAIERAVRKTKTLYRAAGHTSASRITHTQFLSVAM